MIFKMRMTSSSDIWIWVDQIKKAQSYGYMYDVNSSRRGLKNENPGVFSKATDLLASVESMWGDERSFDDEIWPEFADGEPGRTVTSIRLDRENGQQLLALAAGPSFLLSESGDTIERLSY